MSVTENNMELVWVADAAAQDNVRSRQARPRFALLNKSMETRVVGPYIVNFVSKISPRLPRSVIELTLEWTNRENVPY